MKLQNLMIKCDQHLAFHSGTSSAISSLVFADDDGISKVSEHSINNRKSDQHSSLHWITSQTVLSNETNPMNNNNNSIIDVTTVITNIYTTTTTNNNHNINNNNKRNFSSIDSLYETVDLPRTNLPTPMLTTTTMYTRKENTGSTIYMFGGQYLGGIKHYFDSSFYSISEISSTVKTEISDQRELLAVRTFYYQEAGDEHEEGNAIDVPGKWIQSGTLVEFEALGDCPKHVSSEACHGATIPDTTCIWCETANMCITSNDKDLHEFKVNGCKNKSSTVIVATEPTTLATTETDLKKTSPGSESHLNMTTDTTTPATTETDLRNELKKTSSSTESHLNMTTYTAEHMEETKTLQYR
ncbi:unnamed protein product [Schistosoma bovis]|nr:unnamed protein product [Schistosoma bovis]